MFISGEDFLICMARFKNTVADVEAKLIIKKNTVLIMQEDVQVFISKSGVTEQERAFFMSVLLFQCLSRPV